MLGGRKGGKEKEKMKEEREIQTIPNLKWFNLRFFNQRYENDMHSVETLLQILNFNPFLGYRIV